MDVGNQSPQEPQLMRANRQVIETTCSLCQQRFQLAEAVYACPFCQGFHHAACWEAQRQCTYSPVTAAAGKAATGAEVPPLTATPAEMVGQTVPFETGFDTGFAPDERRCPTCAEIIKREALKCRFCGAVLDARLIQPGAEAETANLPGLPWVAVLALAFVTFGLFPLFWGIRQGYWARKMDRSSNAMLFYVLYFVLTFLSGMFGGSPDLAVFGSILTLGGVVLLQCGNFNIKQEIESQFNRSLSGVMTFFFGPIYHQYHFNQIAKERSENLSILNT